MTTKRYFDTRDRENCAELFCVSSIADNRRITLEGNTGVKHQVINYTGQDGTTQNVKVDTKEKELI